MKIVFIRHGDPDYANDTLTEKGRREAEALSNRVKDWDVKEFYCSPLGRAKDTAAYSLEKMGREAKIYDWLKEFYVNVKDPIAGFDRIPWDFMPAYFTEQKDLFDNEKWLDTDVMKSGKVREEYEKVCNGLDEILKNHGYEREKGYYRVKEGNEDTIVFFCHLGVSFVMLSHLLNIPPTILWQGFFVAPTSVTTLCTEEREEGIACFRVKTLGDVNHLINVNEPPSNSGFFCERFDG